PLFLFFIHPPPSDISPLSLHDALPIWRYPFGSGGKRVTTSETLPSRTSAATISRMKSRRSGEAGVLALTRLSLVISIRVMQHVRSEEHTSELQSLTNLVCRLLLYKKKN